MLLQRVGQSYSYRPKQQGCRVSGLSGFQPVSATASHTAITLFLKSSFVAKSVTNAATNAETTVITIPIGLGRSVYPVFSELLHRW